MPTKFIPLIGPQGVITPEDVTDKTGGYRSFINGYFEKTDSEVEHRDYAYTKRPGIATKFDSVTPFTNDHNIQGLLSSIDRTSMIAYSNDGSAANTTWYIPNTGIPVSRGTAPAAAGNWTYSGPVCLTALDGISYGANVYYCATDFTKGAIINSTGTWTEITDADFTGLSKCTNMIGVDGYLFIGTTNNRIYNSDLNASTAWTSTSFLTAADTPGRLLWIAKIRNFLIVFKDKSIEFFENVGNPTPGSPLEPRKSLTSRIGLLHRNTVREVSDGIIFAGLTETGMAKMYKISNQDLSINPISNRHIEQMLPALKIATSTSDYSVDSVASASFLGQSQVFYMMGKEFYTVNISSIGAGATETVKFTQVYDNTLGIWTSWATSFTTSATEDTYGFQASQAQPLLIGNVNTTVFVNNTYSGASAPPVLMAVDPTNLLWYDRKSDASQNVYNFSWNSDQHDFGNRKRKFMDSLEIHYTGDSTATPSASASTSLTLKYRDWDYNTTGAPFMAVSRTMYYDPGGGVRCIARRLGSFRKRAFTIILAAVAAMKIWGIEIQYNSGETDQES